MAFATLVVQRYPESSCEVCHSCQFSLHRPECFAEQGRGDILLFKARSRRKVAAVSPSSQGKKMESGCCHCPQPCLSLANYPVAPAAWQEDQNPGAGPQRETGPFLASGTSTACRQVCRGLLVHACRTGPTLAGAQGHRASGQSKAAFRGIV